MRGSRAADALRAAPLTLLAALLAVVLAVHVKQKRKGAVIAHEARASAPGPASAVPAWLASPAGSGAAPAGAPRMQHGERARRARSAARGPTRARVRWKTALGGAIEAQVVASPDERTLYAATLGGELVALARDDGSVRFRKDLGGRSYATPCVSADGNVYSASDAKKVFAFRPDGLLLWSLDLDDEADTACALADDGTIVLAAGRTVYGVRPNGDVAWRFAAKGKVFTGPAIDDAGLVVVGSQDHRVYGIREGKKVFEQDLGADVDGAPAIDDDGDLVVGTDAAEVVRLDGKGSVLWRSNVGGFVRGPLSVARNGDVLAGVYGPRSREVRLDGRTGVEKASFDVEGTGASEFGVHGGAVEDSTGALYFGGQDDRLHALGASGVELFSFRTGADVDAPPTLLSDGSLVVASDDGTVYYLEP